MAKIPELGRYTRNPTQMGRVYPIADGYWAGYAISFRNFHRYGSGMGLGDTRPKMTYSFTRTIYPIIYPNFFIYIFIFH
ncbi:hypothetical protein Hanom_Chr02g00098521 [Helianthus anomalus]